MKKTKLNLSKTTIRSLTHASRVAGGISLVTCHTVDDHCKPNTSGGVLCGASDATDCKSGLAIGSCTC